MKNYSKITKILQNKTPTPKNFLLIYKLPIEAYSSLFTNRLTSQKSDAYRNTGLSLGRIYYYQLVTETFSQTRGVILVN